MRIYLAGNFNISKKVTLEAELKKKLGESYHRLCTYFYPIDAENIITGEPRNVGKKRKKPITAGTGLYLPKIRLFANPDSD